MSKLPAHLLIAGALGHGKVVAEAAQISGRWQRIAFIDDAYPDLTEVLGFQVLASYDQAPQLLQEFPFVVVALSDHERRTRLQDRLNLMGYHLARIIHPNAVISPSATIGAGTVVFANAVINANSTIGRGCIINTGAVVEHDTIIADCVHISPNATVSGGVKVGAHSWIGAGATLIHNVKVGESTIVGAGAVVLRDVPDYSTVVGIPAQPIGVGVSA